MIIKPLIYFFNLVVQKDLSKKNPKSYSAVALATAFFVLINQIAPVSLFAAAGDLQPLDEIRSPAASMSPAAENISASAAQVIPIETSLDYLQDDLILHRVPSQLNLQSPKPAQDSEKPAEESVSSETSSVMSAAEQEDFSFSGALDFLKQQTANLKAAVVKKMTKENLIALARLPYEIGLAVVDGIVMMFTSYEADNLNGTSALKAMLDGLRTTFLMHFQPHTAEPSRADREGAAERGDRMEHTASLKADGSADIDVMEYRSTEESIRVIESDELIARIEREQKDDISFEQLSVFAKEIQDALKGPAERYRSEPPTVFSGEPTLGSFASASPFATVNTVQTSSAVFRINYNVSVNGSYAGGVMNFSPPNNVSSLSKFTFEMLTNNSCLTTNCLKLEVVDSANRKASVYIKGLKSTYQQVDIPFATLRVSRPDLDFSQIKQITFVEESALTNPKNGYLEVKTGGLAFTPSVAGTTYNAAALTTITGNPALSSAAASTLGDVDGSIAVTQTSPRDFSFTYALPENDDFAFVVIPSAPPQSLSAGLSLAASIPTGKKMKVEVKDVNNKIADFWLVGAGSKQNYVLTLSGADNVPLGFNAALIKQITLVVDKVNAGTSGTIVVETKGLDYLPPVTGTAYSAAAISVIPGNPSIGSGKGDADNDSSITVNQADTRNFSMNYTLTDEEDFVFTTLNLSSNQSLTELTLAATIAAGKKIKVEVKDKDDRVADFLLVGTGAKQNYRLVFSGDNVPAGFLNGQIKSIVLVADKLRSGASGNVPIEVGGLNFAPVVTGAPYIQSAINALPGYPVLGSGKGDTDGDASVTVNQTSARNFTMAYSLPDETDFAFSSLNFASPQSLASGIVLAATIPAGKKIKVEVKDASNRIADYYLLGTGAKQNYTLSLSGQDIATGFDKTKIVSVTFVADTANSGNNGSIAIETYGLSFAPNLTGSVYTQSAINALPGYPVLGSGKGEDLNENASVTVNQTSARNFTMAYSLPDETDFAFSSLNFPTPQSLASGIVLAATIPAGKKIKVEVKDASNKIADYYLVGNGTKQNYTMPLAGEDVPLGFDKTKILSVTFVADPAIAGTSGSIAIETYGLSFAPSLTGSVYTQSALNTLPGYPVVGGGKGGDLDDDSSVTVNQVNSREVAMSYALHDEEDFAFVTISFATGQNLSSGLVLAANIPAGKKIKVEVKDVSNKTADYYLVGTGTRSNYTLSLTGEDVVSGFNAARIALIAFVADTANSGAVGNFSIETKGLNFIPNVTGAAYVQSAINTLPAYPVLSSGKGDEDENASVTVNQTSARDFTMAYTLTDETDFAFSTLTFPTPQSLTSGIVLAATIPAGKKIKVEVKDSSNKMADYYLVGTGAKNNYTLSLAGDDIPTGFDKTKISTITFVADFENAGTSGSIAIETKGMGHTPNVIGAVYTQSAINTLPAYPVLGSGKGDPDENSTVTINQTSARDFTMAYTLADETDFAFSTLSFAAPQNLSTGIVLAATIPAGKKIKVEVKDATGKLADYYLVGTGAKKNYTLPLSGEDIPTVFDKTRVSLITFVADVTNAGTSGSIAIETKGMNYTPALTGTAYTPGVITNLPGYPVLGSGKSDVDDNSTVGVVQASSKDFSMSYELTDPEDFAFSTLSFPSPQNLPSGIILAANIPAGKKIKVEVKDALNKIADYYLTGTGVKQNYTLTLAGEDVPTGFNKAQISLITFVAEPLNAGATGVIAIETGGMKIAPSVTGTAYNQSAITNLPLYPILGKGINDEDEDSTVTLNQTSARDFTMAYNLADSTDFAFSTVSFPAPQNFTSGIVLAANIPAGKKIKVEIKDANTKVAAYYLTGTGVKQNYTLTLVGDGTVTGFDRTRISLITFVADTANAGSTGTIAIETKGMNYTPALTGTVYTAAAITNLPGSPVLGSGKNDLDDNSNTGVDQTSSKNFSMTYELMDPEDFAFSTLSFPSPQNLPSGIVLAATIPAGKKIKVEVKDALNKIADYYLTGTGVKQNYTLTLAGEDVPTGFNKAQISLITFVAEPLNAGAEGVISIETGGMKIAPSVTGTAYNQSAITNLPLYPVVGKGINDADENSTVTVNQTSARDFTMAYTLADSTDFAFSTVSMIVPQNFSTGIVLAANIPAGKKIKVEIKDANTKVASYYLTGTGVKQNYTLTLVGDGTVPGFDKTRISQITFVADVTNAGSTGTIAVETKGLNYTPALTGTAYTQSVITNLPAYPVLGSGKNDLDENSTTAVNQTSSSAFSMSYALTDPEDFAFSTLAFPSAQNLSSGIVLAATIPAGKKIKVEVKDALNKIADYYLVGTGVKQNYTLVLAGEDVPAGFDKTRITLITFVAEPLNAGSTGSFAVETKGMSYSPVISGQPYNAAAHTNLPDYPAVAAGKSDPNENSEVSVDQTSSSAFALNYNLTDEDDFGYARIAFATPKPMTGFVFAADLAVGQRMKVEIKDANGKKVSFWITGGGAMLNYSLSLVGEHVPAGFLTDFIADIVFVVDPLTMGASGSVPIETNGLEYTPVISV